MNRFYLAAPQFFCTFSSAVTLTRPDILNPESADSGQVAPGGDKGRYFSAALSTISNPRRSHEKVIAMPNHDLRTAYKQIRRDRKSKERWYNTVLEVLARDPSAPLSKYRELRENPTKIEEYKKPWYVINHPAARRDALAKLRLAAFRDLFPGRGYCDELRRAIAFSDPDWIRAIVKKQFAQLQKPGDQAALLRGYVRLFPDIAAEDPWFVQRRPLIPDLEDTKQSATPKKQPQRPGAKKKPKSQQCAIDIAKIHSELQTIARSVQAGQEDYDRLRKENPGFLTFKAVKKSPQLRDKVLAVGSSWKGRLLSLAQELAGEIHTVKTGTAKYYWTHRPKPAPVATSK